MSNELFEKAPIRTAYLKLAIPVVMSMVVQLVYSMVDTYFIALTGNTALIAGVSICTPLFTLFLAFGDMFALGGSTFIIYSLVPSNLMRTVGHPNASMITSIIGAVVNQCHLVKGKVSVLLKNN